MIGTGGKWSERDEKVFLESWPLVLAGTMTTADLARRLGRTPRSIARRAHQLGLERARVKIKVNVAGDDSVMPVRECIDNLFKRTR